MLEKHRTVLKTKKKFYSLGVLNSCHKSSLHLDPLNGNFLIEKYLFALTDLRHAKPVNEKWGDLTIPRIMNDIMHRRGEISARFQLENLSIRKKIFLRKILIHWNLSQATATMSRKIISTNISHSYDVLFCVQYIYIYILRMIILHDNCTAYVYLDF